MSQLLIKTYLHAIHSTIDWRPIMNDKDLGWRLHAHFAGACRNLNSTSMMVRGTDDHIHVLGMYG